MRVSNPDCSPVGINRRNTAPTPTGFAEIVGDYFPVLHLRRTAWLSFTAFSALTTLRFFRIADRRGAGPRRAAALMRHSPMPRTRSARERVCRLLLVVPDAADLVP